MDYYLPVPRQFPIGKTDASEITQNMGKLLIYNIIEYLRKVENNSAVCILNVYHKSFLDPYITQITPNSISNMDLEWSLCVYEKDGYKIKFIFTESMFDRSNVYIAATK